MLFSVSSPSDLLPDHYDCTTLFPNFCVESVFPCCEPETVLSQGNFNWFNLLPIKKLLMADSGIETNKYIFRETHLSSLPDTSPCSMVSYCCCTWHTVPLGRQQTSPNSRRWNFVVCIGQDSENLCFISAAEFSAPCLSLLLSLICSEGKGSDLLQAVL